MTAYDYPEKSLPYRIPSSFSPPASLQKSGVLQGSRERGPGLLACSNLVATRHDVDMMSPTAEMADLWSRTSLADHSPSHPSHSLPDIFSPAYDPFASVHGQPNTSAYLGSAASSTPPHLPELSSSPDSSCDISIRSSFSFHPLHEMTRQEVDQSLRHGIKAEDAPDWFHNIPARSNSDPTLSTSDFLGMSEAAFPRSEQGGIIHHLPDPSSSDLRLDALQSSLGRRLHLDGGARERPLQYGDDGTITTNVTRMRKRRQLTTSSDANHGCKICGKLFGRSYNFKAHMETHDPARVYAHACPERHCDKKFVRKTDLTRHHQSVHMKQRNFRCELCGNMFARKDTLRRHTEDGCSKRFEISSKASRMTEDLGYGDETVPVQTSAGVVPMRRRFLNGDIPFSPTSAPCGMQGSSSTELRSLAQAGIAGKGITGTHNSLGFQA